MQPVSPISRTPYSARAAAQTPRPKVPEGRRAFAHRLTFMACGWNRNPRPHHMGRRGVCLGRRLPHFTKGRDKCCQFGDGTYSIPAASRSGRAIASGRQITYKILYNEATAMTGGQHVEAELATQQITFSYSEGIAMSICLRNPSLYPRSDIAPASRSPIATRSTAFRKNCRTLKGHVGERDSCRTAQPKTRRAQSRGLVEDPPPPRDIKPAVVRRLRRLQCSRTASRSSRWRRPNSAASAPSQSQSTGNKIILPEGFVHVLVTVDRRHDEETAGRPKSGEIGELPEPASTSSGPA